ncbi:hypothetical protein DITRI_Ditri05aG0105600 [Diplodiscus trichospermus]
MKKAIILGRNKWIDGSLINVKKAYFGWEDRRRKVVFKSVNGKSVDKDINLHLFNEKDRKSYKDTVIGVTADRREEIPKSPSNPRIETNDHIGDLKEWDKFFEVNYNVEIPNKEVEWLEMSVIRRLQKDMTVRRVNNLMREALLIAKSWFEFWEEWNHSTTQRKFDVWVSIEEVPLQLWNDHFFKTMGDRWRTFIRLDENTATKKKLDIARILVKVNNRFKIPAVVMVHHREKSFKILVSLEDIEDGQNIFDKVFSLSENKNSYCLYIETTGSELEFKPWKMGGIEDMTKEFSLNLSEYE